MAYEKKDFPVACKGIKAIEFRVGGVSGFCLMAQVYKPLGFKV